MNDTYFIEQTKQMIYDQVENEEILKEWKTVECHFPRDSSSNTTVTTFASVETLNYIDTDTAIVIQILDSGS